MIAFSIGSIDVYWYGIFYIISFLVSYLFLWYLSYKNVFSSYPIFKKFLYENLDDIFLYSIIGVLLGGRLGYVIIYEFDLYLANPLDIFKIWQGGMSFIGGMLGVTLAMIILKYIKNLKKLDFILLFDSILAIVPFGIMLGRIGNFLNKEIYGIPVSDVFPNLSIFWINLFSKINFFYVYENVDNLLRVNTNFLSSFFEGFVLLFIMMIIVYHWIKYKSIKIGQTTGIFLLGYSFVRFFLEYLRFDSQSEFVLLFTKSQWFFILFFILGIYFIFGIKEKKSNNT